MNVYSSTAHTARAGAGTVRGSVDVELSNRQNQIYAHVVAEVAGEVSREQAHRIESELEETIRREIPEIHEVVTRATA